MDKIINIFFKIGKILVFMLFLTLFFAIVASIYFVSDTFKPNEVKAPTFEEIVARSDSIYGSKTTSTTKNQNVEPYLNELNGMLKTFLTEYGKRNVLERLRTVDSNEKLKYVVGLKEVFIGAQLYCKNKKYDNYKCSNLFLNEQK